MNCQRFEDVVNDIAREQIMDAGALADALGHSEGCQSCAARLEDERAMTLRLRGLAAGMESAGAPARVETQLLAAFDEFALIQTPAQVSARRYRARYFMGAIAAGLVIVFGVSAIRWRQPALATQPADTPLVAILSAPANPTSSPAPAVPSELPGKRRNLNVISQRSPTTARHDARRVSPADVRPANAGNTEIATDFLPLTYGATTNLEEGGRMVRVELPHSAMATFGLPVNMDRANERVKADVIFGVDGLAHAIRFVR